jgi:hypothetical protein
MVTEDDLRERGVEEDVEENAEEYVEESVEEAVEEAVEEDVEEDVENVQCKRIDLCLIIVTLTLALFVAIFILKVQQY